MEGKHRDNFVTSIVSDSHNLEPSLQSYIEKILRNNPSLLVRTQLVADCLAASLEKWTIFHVILS